MKLNIKLLQFLLALVGVFLIIITYFFIPQTNISTDIETSDKKIKQNENKILIGDKTANLFDNVEYKGFYNINNSFSVKSKKAYILDDEPDIVYMTMMHVTLYMNNGKIINITSDEGTYNKVSYDCFFKYNVNATDGKTIITSQNLDLLSDENFASVYNDVVIEDPNGNLKADIVTYDFENELYNISMYKDKSVKAKLIK